MEFVRLRCPEQIDRVHAVMKRRGAYGRYKELLAEKNLLEDWYAFENDRTREALLEWCKEFLRPNQRYLRGEKTNEEGKTAK